MLLLSSWSRVAAYGITSIHNPWPITRSDVTSVAWYRKDAELQQCLKTFILNPFGYVYGRMYTCIYIYYIFMIYDIHFIKAETSNMIAIFECLLTSPHIFIGESTWTNIFP